MYFVTMTLMEAGASTSKEMKYFDRNYLEELGVLENEEIDRIMKFIQESWTFWELHMYNALGKSILWINGIEPY